MLKVLRYVGKTIQIAVTVLLAVLLVCNVYLIIMERIAGEENPAVFGYFPAVIASGSMEPALGVDDMILNHAQEDYACGDIITFRSGNGLVTHRIVDEGEDGFVTQGDANNAPDTETVQKEDIVGRVVLIIPYIGGGIAFLKTPLGMTILVFTGFLLIELPFFFERRRGQTSGEENEYEKES